MIIIIATIIFIVGYIIGVIHTSIYDKKKMDTLTDLLTIALDQRQEFLDDMIFKDKGD